VDVADKLLAIPSVSRETIDQLCAYVEILKKWQQKINLISDSTLNEIWIRHILDCAQLLSYLPSTSVKLFDIGSGAGLPGLILAVAGVKRVTLVESDARKAEFLRAAARELGITSRVNVLNCRVEGLSGIEADTITARALATIDKILTISAGIRGQNTIYLLQRGRGVEQELTEAGKRWRFSVERFSSLTDPSGVILRLGNIRREHHTASRSS
jgi:16S rRNA (guanine527-N7)-methyltransferase